MAVARFLDSRTLVIVAFLFSLLCRLSRWVARTVQHRHAIAPERRAN